MRRVTRDLAVVTVALLLLVSGSLSFGPEIPFDHLPLVLTPFAAAGGATAAILALLAARLKSDGRLAWLSASLGLYSLVVIPAATAGVLGIGSPAAVGAVRFLAQCLVVATLAIALLAPPPSAGRQAVGALLGAATAIATAALLGSVFPSVAQMVTDWRPLRLAIGLLWVSIAVAMAVVAAQRQEWALWCLNGGLALLGAAISARVALAPTPVADLGLTFSVLRLAAITLVVGGAARLAQEALARVDIDYEAREEELRLAHIQLDRAAERDHELRNGLAGLAGATRMMRTKVRDADVTELGTAVAAELSRLDDLLQTPGHIHRVRSLGNCYAVAPLLRGLAALHNSSGMDLHLDVEPELRARGSSSTLAQVVTNLLGNAERHAPGSPVRIIAGYEAEAVVIRIRDFGPGIAPGRELAVFERGIRGRRSSGSGLGLHICRNLLTAEDGAIEIRPSSPGCTVVVRIPAVVRPAAWQTTTAASTAS